METIDELTAKKLLKKYQLPLVKEELATSKDQAIIISKKIGFPLFMKINSPEIHHKTDIGGVFEARNELEIEIYYEKIIKNAKQVTKKIKGILIERKIEGIELIIGVNKDPQFGHVIMFGLGGIYVELIKDINFRAIPLSKKDANELIESMQTKKILEGFRQFKPVKKDKIAKILLEVSNMIQENQDIAELDINPLIINEKEAVIVDALIKRE